MTKLRRSILTFRSYDLRDVGVSGNDWCRSHAGQRWASSCFSKTMELVYSEISTERQELNRLIMALL